MRLLIIKTSSFGDIAQALSVLDYLKKIPNCQVDFVVERRCLPLLQDVEGIHKILVIDSKAFQFKGLRNVQYDVVFDLQGNCKSALVLALVKAKVKVGFGKKSVSEWPNLLFTNKKFNPPSGQNIRDDYLFLVKSYFKEEVAKSFQEVEKRELKHIMVAPGSMWPSKQLPVETLQLFLSFIDQKFHPRFYFIWGTEKEEEFVRQLKVNSSEVIDKQSLPQLKNLMQEMDLVISMDSLPLHLADLASTPTFSIFGPSSGKKYAPIGPSHAYYQGKCPFGKVFEKRCDILRHCNEAPCMRKIEAPHLYASFLNFANNQFL